MTTKHHINVEHMLNMSMSMLTIGHISTQIKVFIIYLETFT